MPRPYSMAKRAEATNQTRRRIEAALIRLLGSRPYSAITIAEIAAEADVAVRTVQRHFRAKDELLTACARFAENVFQEAWRQRPAPRSAEEDLRTAVVGMFSVYAERAAEAWAVYSRSADIPELAQALRISTSVRTALIDELLARWPDAWSVGQDTARRLILSLTSFPAWRGFTDPGRFSREEAGGLVASLLVRSLLSDPR